MNLMSEAEDQAAAGQQQVGRTERDREGAERAVGDAAGRAGMLNAGVWTSTSP